MRYYHFNKNSFCLFLPGLISIYFICVGCIFAQNSKKSILFIGNSYSYYNDLPRMVGSMVESSGDSVFIDQILLGGATFQSHSANPQVLEKINSRKWTYVVLQEQSQRPSFPPTQVNNEVYPYAKILVNQILKNDSCSIPVFYMTWGRKYGDKDNCANYPPLCTYMGMQQRISETYRELAKQNNGILAPAGMAWQESINKDSLFNLYVEDNSHPNVRGSYLSALTIFETIYKKSTVGMKYLAALPDSEAVKMQIIAHKITSDSMNLWWENAPIPNADFVFEQDSLSRQLTFTAATKNCKNYLWKFGDGESSNLQNPKHIYYKTGEYKVVLIYDNGCLSDSIIKTVNIKTPTNLQELENINITAGTDQSKQIYINLGKNPSNNIQSIELLDMSGRLIQKFDIKNQNSSTYKFNLEKNDSGIYLLRFFTGQRYLHKKFILE